jgi:hypothetical protein
VHGNIEECRNAGDVDVDERRVGGGDGQDDAFIWVLLTKRRGEKAEV